MTPVASSAGSSRLMTLLGYALLLFAAAAALMPFWWMVATSFKGDKELFVFPPTWLPLSFGWRNYADAIAAPGTGRQLINSLVYAFGSTLSNVIFCAMAGYALARLTFPGRNAIFGLMLVLLMVPAQSQIVPVYMILQHIPFTGGNNWMGVGGTGLLNTYAGLILPNAATPFGIFMMRQFFSRLPLDYEEAARLDGAGSFTIFWRVVLPLARPPIAVLSVLSFQHAWNDFIWPLILTTNPNMATLQLGLQLLQTGPDTRWNVVMAAATLITLPVIAVFLVAQKYVIDQGVASGVK